MFSKKKAPPIKKGAELLGGWLPFLKTASYEKVFGKIIAYFVFYVYYFIVKSKTVLEHKFNKLLPNYNHFIIKKNIFYKLSYPSLH